MAYVAVKGGSAAIEKSIENLKYKRVQNGDSVDIHQLQHGMRGLIDSVMSESALYSPELAAIAIKQAEGSLEEAVFLIRAFRTTLPRKHYSRVIDGANMHVQRRISACFKDIHGGQILGATYDYTHRLLDFSLIEENSATVTHWLNEFHKELQTTIAQDKTIYSLSRLPKVTDYLRQEGLIPSYADNNDEPIDITKKNLQFPSKRCERLQILTRGQTASVISFGYAALRGYGDLHPTVGELRVGNMDICIDNPSGNGAEDDAYYIGQICMTEVETYIAKPDNKDLTNQHLELDIGYGACFGQNESKAIAMSMLDNCLQSDNPQHPTQNEEFVLYHIDSVEATGFISHLKLPHYVTFQSKLDSIRKTRTEENKNKNEI